MNVIFPDLNHEARTYKGLVRDLNVLDPIWKDPEISYIPASFGTGDFVRIVKYPSATLDMQRYGMDKNFKYKIAASDNNVRQIYDALI